MIFVSAPYLILALLLRRDSRLVLVVPPLGTGVSWRRGEEMNLKVPLLIK